jgi:alpha-L-fucosidase
VPPNQERRLRFLGDWLGRNGEAVYATRALGLARQPEWGYLTRSKAGDRLYAIVRRWPEDGRLRVPVVAQPLRARVLGGNAEIPVETGSDGFTVRLAGLSRPEPLASVIVIDVQPRSLVVP